MDIDYGYLAWLSVCGFLIRQAWRRHDALRAARERDRRKLSDGTAGSEPALRALSDGTRTPRLPDRLRRGAAG
jgi:hypothetical protein